jgi:large subunit ribosomal protein L4
MSKVKVYNIKGEKVKDIELSSDVFGLPSNNELVHQVYVALDANQRTVIASTKDRSDRAGSGRKPWKQKGTGRARTGSVRNPIWRKGGVIFGPSNERNFKKKINKKVNVKAIKIVLSEKVRSGNLIVLDKIELKEKKTKEVASIFDKLKITGKTLLGLSEKEKDVYVCSRNIEGVNTVSAQSLNVLDMLNSKNLILSLDSVKYLEEKYKK